MDRSTQPGPSRAAERLGEPGAGPARRGLVAVDRQRDDARMPSFDQPVHQLDRFGVALLAEQADAEADRRQPVGPRLAEPGVDRVDESEQIVTPRRPVDRVDDQVRVHDAGRSLPLREAIRRARQLVRGPNQPAGQVQDLEERREVSGVEEALDRRRKSDARPVGERDEVGCVEASLQVDVDLRLRHGPDEVRAGPLIGRHRRPRFCQSGAGRPGWTAPPSGA